jgi:hypothetical protein
MVDLSTYGEIARRPTYSQVLLEPGSRLPPNEIFGSESALGGILVPLLAVGALAVPGLLLSVLLGIAERYDRKLWIVEPVTPAAYPPA